MNLATKKMTIVLTTLAFLILAIDAADAQDNRLRLRGRLVGQGEEHLASGKADYRERGNRRRFSVEMEDLRDVGVVIVTVNGKSVGTIRVRDGGFDLNLRSIPSLKAGDSVAVINGVTGATIAATNLRVK